MLLYRQKILLALLQALGGKVGSTDFQKYLFIYSGLYEKDRSYDFLPYRFGCYSFQASSDKQKLIDKNYLSEEDSWALVKPKLNYLRGMKKEDERRIGVFAEKFASMRGDELIRHVYKNHPYYAINSEIAEHLLSADELANVIAAKPKKRRKPLFATIGYEGDSIEVYVNKLIRNDVRMLVDVRKNPLSRKYGFSKRSLSSMLGRFNIQYAHIPELGIESSERQGLQSQDDYDRLFDAYESTTLVEQNSALSQLYSLFEKNRRIAITCFEKDHCQCHRGRVSNKIEQMSKGAVVTQHL